MHCLSFVVSDNQNNCSFLKKYELWNEEFCQPDGFGEFSNQNGMFEKFYIGGKFDFYLPIKSEFVKDVFNRKTKIFYRNGCFHANQLMIKEVDFDYLKTFYFIEKLNKLRSFKSLNVKLNTFEEFKLQHQKLSENECSQLYYKSNKQLLWLIVEMFGEDKQHYAYSTTNELDIIKDFESLENYLTEDFQLVFEREDVFLNLDNDRERIDLFFNENITSPTYQDKWITVVDLVC